MPVVEVSEFIAAPRELVWERSTDIDSWTEQIEAIIKVENLTGGPMRVGTRFRETRIMFGKEATETMEVAEFEPTSHYVVTAESHGSKYRTEIRFEDETGQSGDGTRMSFKFEGVPQTFGAKVLGAIMLPMMKGMLRKCIGGDLKDLKRVCERQAGAPA